MLVPPLYLAGILPSALYLLWDSRADIRHHHAWAIHQRDHLCGNCHPERRVAMTLIVPFLAIFLGTLLGLLWPISVPASIIVRIQTWNRDRKLLASIRELEKQMSPPKNS